MDGFGSEEGAEVGGDGERARTLGLGGASSTRGFRVVFS